MVSGAGPQWCGPRKNGEIRGISKNRTEKHLHEWLTGSSELKPVTAASGVVPALEGGEDKTSAG